MLMAWPTNLFGWMRRTEKILTLYKMAATSTTTPRFTLADSAEAETKFFTEENGRKFIVEMINIKDLENNCWIAKTHGRPSGKILKILPKLKLLKDGKSCKRITSKQLLMP